MKTPDEIKKGLECCGGDCFNGNEECPYDKDDLKENISCIRWMSKDALAYIQQLEKRIIHLGSLNQSILSTITMQERTRARLMEDISQLEAQVPKWISVEERLPEHGEVLICTVGNAVLVAWHHGSGRFETSSGLRFSTGGVLRVSHWMPLPEPPKEDDV